MCKLNQCRKSFGTEAGHGECYSDSLTRAIYLFDSPFGYFRLRGLNVLPIYSVSLSFVFRWMPLQSFTMYVPRLSFLFNNVHLGIV